ncbi:hypothetical protein [Cellulosimicrobium cellulans]|uniref:hypothetical protein n=1 Tax=Cellulosimicrobium cellulans TaxID=1710 RepID=UPI0009F3B4DC|nr:hypothetical protein [Cellulosimicrobium cellulans]
MRAEEGERDHRGGEAEEHALGEAVHGRDRLRPDDPDEDRERGRATGDGTRVPACGASHGVAVREVVQRGGPCRAAHERADDEDHRRHGAREEEERERAPHEVVGGGDEQRALVYLCHGLYRYGDDDPSGGPWRQVPAVRAGRRT